VGGDEVAVPVVSTVETREVAPARFGNPGVTGGTGAGGPAFIDAGNPETGEFGFVGDRGHEVGSSPGAQPPVVHRAGVVVGDALRVADEQRADPLADRPVHQAAGGFMVGLADPPL